MSYPDSSFLRGLGAELGTTPEAAAAVVVSTIVIYLAFVIILDASRQTMYARASVVELAVVAVLGAVVGRTALGLHPTLATGLLALTTLGVIRTAVAVFRRVAYQRDRPVRTAAPVLAPRRDRGVVVMAGTDVRHAALRRLRLDEGELWTALRRAGVRSPEEVALVIVESTGAFTVLRSGSTIDRRLLAGVGGLDGLPEGLLR